MHILVTGGTGFIGRRLVSRLLTANHKVTVLSRQNAKDVRRLLTSEVRPVNSLKAVNPSVVFDAIINLAGEGIMDQRWTHRRKRELLSSRIDTTQELVKLIERLEQPPKLLISGSAVGYYGGSDENVKLDEHSPAGDDFAASLCVRWENAARQAEELGVRLCLLRTGVVLHSEGGALQEMLPPFRLGLGGALGTGKQMLSWIHMDDMVNLILFLLESEGSQGVYNATAPEPVSNREFSKCFAKVLRRPAVVRMPAFVMKLMLGESAELLLKGQNVLPAHLMEQGFEFQYPTINSALKALFERKK